MNDFNEPTEQTVIVVGCGTGGLAVIRALGRRPGIRIVAATHNQQSVGLASKYVSESVLIPHAATHEKEFIDFFIDRGEEWKGALILEITDDAAMALSKNKERLNCFYHLATADWSIVEMIVQKSALYQLADECEVPHPKTFNPESLEEINGIAERVRYPCIIKPVFSHEFVAAFNIKVFQAEDPAALRHQFKKCLAAGVRVMIQEIVVGPDSNLERMQCYVDRSGKLVSRFFNNKLRQAPPSFGVMRVGTSVPRNEEVEALGERILKRANYRGYASIEFKRDSRDGQLNLIEINVRMPRNGWLAISSGVDFPWIALNDIVYGKTLDVTDYTEDQYWIELFPEIRYLIQRRGQKWLGWRDLLRPYFAKHCAFAVFSLSDPRPFLSQTKRVLCRFLFESRPH